MCGSRNTYFSFFSVHHIFDLIFSLSEKVFSVPVWSCISLHALAKMSYHEEK